jgi:hypothetical protein
MIEINSEYTIKLDDTEIKLTEEQAMQLYNLLKAKFDNNNGWVPYYPYYPYPVEPLRPWYYVTTTDSGSFYSITSNSYSILLNNRITENAI